LLPLDFSPPCAEILFSRQLCLFPFLFLFGLCLFREALEESSPRKSHSSRHAHNHCLSGTAPAISSPISTATHPVPPASLSLKRVRSGRSVRPPQAIAIPPGSGLIRGGLESSALNGLFLDGLLLLFFFFGLFHFAFLLIFGDVSAQQDAQQREACMRQLFDPDGEAHELLWVVFFFLSVWVQNIRQ
jgi:hypothetical protein